MKKQQVIQVGFVLGAVFIIMGIAYSNSGLGIMGGIFLAIGLWMKFIK